MSSARLRWYYHRLRSMPLREIPHRVAEAAKKRRDRRGAIARRAQHVPDAVLAADLPALPLDHARLDAIPVKARETLERDADALLCGSFTLLGQTWPLGSRRDWSLDPETGQHWPHDEFCFDIERRHGAGPGDVKFVWELSRLQHLQVLALASVVLGREDAREAAVSDIVAWFESNPPFRGLGYACGIELASRVVSILVVTALLGP